MLEEQLRKLNQQLSQIKVEPIIHNTDFGLARLNDVRRNTAWRGREIALDQEEVNLK